MIFKGNPVRMCDKRGYIRFGDHLRSNKCLSMLTDSLFEPCGFVTLSVLSYGFPPKIHFTKVFFKKKGFIRKSESPI